MQTHDPALDALLDLHGVILVVDPERGFWVKFVVTRVEPSPEKPHGLDYSLSLHGPDGGRLIGSIMRTGLQSSAQASQRTTVIVCEGFSPMTTPMRPHYSPIFGPKSRSI